MCDNKATVYSLMVRSVRYNIIKLMDTLELLPDDVASWKRQHVLRSENNKNTAACSVVLYRSTCTCSVNFAHEGFQLHINTQCVTSGYTFNVKLLQFGEVKVPNVLCQV